MQPFNILGCAKNLAKFSEGASVWADGLCIGCLGQWAEVKRENSNMQDFIAQHCIVISLIESDESTRPGKGKVPRWREISAWQYLTVA